MKKVIEKLVARQGSYCDGQSELITYLGHLYLISKKNLKYYNLTNNSLLHSLTEYVSVRVYR